MIVFEATPFDHATAITPSDTAGFLTGFTWIKNIGTSGTFVVRQRAGDATYTEYLKQGDSMRVGSAWVGVNLTSLGAGVSLIGYV